MTTAKRSAAVALVRGEEFSVRPRVRSASDEGPAAGAALTLLARVIADVSAREPRP